MRNWAGYGMTLDELASVTFYAFGVGPGADGPVRDPSVEGNHALNLYVIVNEIEGLEPGVYYYRLQFEGRSATKKLLLPR